MPQDHGDVLPNELVPNRVGCTVNKLSNYNQRVGHNTSGIWGQQWKGQAVTAYCDNEAVVCTLNSRYSKDTYLMHMLRTLFFIEAHFQFEISSMHVPGVSNTLADYLSRNLMTKFHANLPHADTHPSHVRPFLLQWLLDTQLDWTSQRWTRKFNSFVNRA